MLTALTKDGKKLCLGNHYKKESLLYFRNKEEFLCPACGEPVILKLGDRRIYHFSHLKGGGCEEYFEKETEYHMEGKKQLYQWLKKQKITAELEYFIKDIRQRPDLMFILNGQKYALEFQCSPISLDSVHKRTHAYLKSNYTPIWILGGMHYHRKNLYSVVLSQFQYLFIRENKYSEWTIPYYCPENRLFIQIYSLYPYSSKNAIANTSIIPQDKISVNALVDPTVCSNFPLKEWKRAAQDVKQNIVHYHKSKSQSFLNEIYQNRLNLFLLPPELGLPVKASPYISTSPVIWQSYLYLDYIRQKKVGEMITLAVANQTIQQRIKTKDISVRQLPQAPQKDFHAAVLQYLETLAEIGLLTRKNNDSFLVNKEMAIPKTVNEQQEMENAFYSQYWGILKRELERRA